MANEQEILARAQQLIKSKQYDEARAILQQIPNNATAQEWLDKISQLGGNPTRVQLEQAQQFIKSEQYDQARTILNQMPDNTTAQKWLAQLDQIAPAKSTSDRSIDDYDPLEGSLSGYDAGAPEFTTATEEAKSGGMGRIVTIGGIVVASIVVTLIAIMALGAGNEDNGDNEAPSITITTDLPNLYTASNADFSLAYPDGWSVGSEFDPSIRNIALIYEAQSVTVDLLIPEQQDFADIGIDDPNNSSPREVIESTLEATAQDGVEITRQATTLVDHAVIGSLSFEGEALSLLVTLIDGEWVFANIDTGDTSALEGDLVAIAQSVCFQADCVPELAAAPEDNNRPPPTIGAPNPSPQNPPAGGPPVGGPGNFGSDSVAYDASAGYTLSFPAEWVVLQDSANTVYLTNNIEFSAPFSSGGQDTSEIETLPLPPDTAVIRIAPFLETSDGNDPVEIVRGIATNIAENTSILTPPTGGSRGPGRFASYVARSDVSDQMGVVFLNGAGDLHLATLYAPFDEAEVYQDLIVQILISIRPGQSGDGNTVPGPQTAGDQPQTTLPSLTINTLNVLGTTAQEYISDDGAFSFIFPEGWFLNEEEASDGFILVSSDEGVAAQSGLDLTADTLPAGAAAFSILPDIPLENETAMDYLRSNGTALAEPGETIIPEQAINDGEAAWTVISVENADQIILMYDRGGSGMLLLGYVPTGQAQDYIASALATLKSYTVQSVSADTTACTETLVVGGCALGSMAADEVDEWELPLVAGDTIRIEVVGGGNFDSYITVLDVDGAVLAESDDGGDGTNAVLVITASVDGAYTAQVSEANNQPGSYRIVASSE